MDSFLKLWHTTSSKTFILNDGFSPFLVDGTFEKQLHF